MLNFKLIRAVVLAAALASLALSGSVVPHVTSGNVAESGVVNGELESVLDQHGAAKAGATFYSLRRDVRRCASPRCGGYFVKRVNFELTRCGDGRWQGECYVAEIDWTGQPQIDEPQMVVRGSIVARRYPGFGNLGELRVSEAWKALGSNRPVGTFYLVRDRGVRCITHPCPTHSAARLNTSSRRNMAGVNLGGAGLDESATSTVTMAMTGPQGVIVTGHDAVVTGPGGRSFELRATQAYVRSTSGSGPGNPGSGSLKPCFKTGCSSQVCSDETVVTTCEFRPEYACYQKAECKRQADGKCGFTKTRELTECLARR